VKPFVWIGVFMIVSLGNPVDGWTSSGVSPDQTEIRQTLHDLEKNIGHIESIQAKFIQIKKMKLFKHEIELSGSFYLQKPDHFAWHTHSPIEHAIVFKNNKVLQWNHETGRVDVISFKDMPVLRTIVEQMQSWFYGSYLSLLDEYKIEIISNAPLRICFIPNEHSFYLKMLEHVVIQFNQEQSAIDSIEVKEKSGDMSIFHFKETLINKEIDPSVWEILSRAS
jgi:hypothetical protein